MKPRLLLPFLALSAAGCSTPSSQVIQMRDGTFRAPTYMEAQEYCEARRSDSQPVGKAPGDTGVLFKCR